MAAVAAVVGVAAVAGTASIRPAVRVARVVEAMGAVGRGKGLRVERVAVVAVGAASSYLAVLDASEVVGSEVSLEKARKVTLAEGVRSPPVGLAAAVAMKVSSPPEVLAKAEALVGTGASVAAPAAVEAQEA